MAVMAEAVSRRQLRAIAGLMRRKFGYQNTLYLPIMELLEHKMQDWFPGFSFEVREMSYFEAAIHGETDPAENVIRIREDVYYGAAAGRGRDRMTIAHEIAHYILLKAQGIKLYRSFQGMKYPAFRDPEWQAKALAGEIMCGWNLIKNMTAADIAVKCGVSMQAAGYITAIMVKEAA